MAKDLPYFKFFCSEWNDGDITLEDFNIQGLFINVCSYYWSNECYLHIDKLKKRFKHNKEDIEYLLKSNLLHNENGFLSIHFLDEQQEERKEKSKKSSIAGKASAERRRLAKLEKELNTNPTPVEIPLNTNPTIKRREEEKREEKNIKSEFETKKEKFILWFNQQKEIKTGKKGMVRVLSKTDDNNLKKLFKDYKLSDFQIALDNMFKSPWVQENKMYTIAHLLAINNFNRYLGEGEKEQKKVIKNLYD